MSEVLTQSERRIPRINHTEALEAAAIAVTNAKCCDCSTGLPIVLCSQPLDVNAVRGALAVVGEWFVDASFFMNDFPPHTHTPAEAEAAAASNLILLATLLREHLRAGNFT